MFQDRLHAQLIPAIQAAFRASFNAEVPAALLSFQPTRPEFEGDITINVFPFLKLSGKGPEPTATAIGEHLQAHLPIVERFNVIKGFLNIVIADRYWLDFLAEAATQDLLALAPTGKRVMVEYASPNTNKPLHLGHLRNIFLGWSVSRILEASGNEVVKVQVINDRGIHICKSMLAWQRFGNGETPVSSGLKGDKLVGKYYVEFDKAYRAQTDALVAEGKTKDEAEKQAPILLEAQDMLRKWEANDPEVRSLWATMNGWVYDGFNATYARIGVGFDKNYYESQTYVLGKNDVLEGLKKGVFYEKDGAVWVDNTAEGLDEKVLLRRDGTSVYMTQDIGTAIERFREYPDLRQLIYTVGNEQDYHFKTLFIILKKLGFPWAGELFHLSYGMVDLPSGKMKSREGTVVDADDLVDEMVATAKQHTEELGKVKDFSETELAELYDTLGLSAMKFYLLRVDPKKTMVFNPQDSIDFHGFTGPFIQYTHARIKSILRKVDGSSIMDNSKTAMNHDPSTMNLMPLEKELIIAAEQYPLMLEQACAEQNPSVIANYIFQLAKTFNSFYTEHSIANAESEAKKQLRLQLAIFTANIIRSGMQLLGIRVPERM